MNVELIRMNRPEASRQYRLYSEQARRDGVPAYLKELRRAYWHLRKGKQVIDVLAAIQLAGVNAEGNPRFAIAKAEHKSVRFVKYDEGSLIFMSHPHSGCFRAVHSVGSGEVASR